MAETYDRGSASSRLMELLARIDFGRRYFEYYEEVRTRVRQGEYNPDQTTLEAVLAETGLDFQYLAKERFFRHVEKRPGFDLVLHAAFPYSTAEFMLYMKSGWGVVGGPWPRLARQVVQASDPAFKPSPLSPKLPFTNETELREVVSFGSTLFSKIRDVMAACGG